MTKEEILKNALIKITQMSDSGSYETSMLRMKQIATEALNNYELSPESENERLKAEREWISVKTELPVNTDRVLVAFNDGTIAIDFFIVTAQCWCNSNYQVAHWMPLPQPPKQ